jgi:hypothetical protein
MVRRKKEGFWEFRRLHLGDIGAEIRGDSPRVHLETTRFSWRRFTTHPHDSTCPANIHRQSPNLNHQVPIK